MDRPEVVAARRRVAVSATCAVAGIALSAVVDQTLGGWVTVLSVAALLHGLHRFGRTGPA
ncbi:MAG TPA: hypothetical protein VF395_00670 [Polyangiaceae bacterium]